ncbi:MAG: porin family protein, partial [Bacteroidales bacterium]|nr:porin family protein [Bacteroidales bacterium]
MKKLFIVFLVQLITGGLAFSQGLYFKLFPGYNLSVSRQQMPDYLTHEVMMPSGSGFGRQNVNLNDPEFSIASGVNLRAAAGYTINDLLSVELRFSGLELRFSGFGNTRKHFEAASQGLNGESEWDFRSLSVMPAIVFGRTVNKTSMNIYAFSGIGAADLGVTTIFSNDRRTIEFDRAPLFSWGFGLEFCYALSGKLSLFADAGISSSYYSP